MSDADMKDIALVITTASPEVLPFISCKGMSPKLVKPEWTAPHANLPSLTERLLRLN